MAEISTTLADLSRRTRKFLEGEIPRRASRRLRVLATGTSTVDLPEGTEFEAAGNGGRPQLKISPQQGQLPARQADISDRFLIYDFSTDRFVGVSEQQFRQRQDFYRQVPGLVPPGAPGELAEFAPQPRVEPVEPLLRELFPLDRDIPALIEWINNNTEEALEVFQDIGRTPETEEMLRLMGAADTDLDEIFVFPTRGAGGEVFTPEQLEEMQTRLSQEELAQRILGVPEQRVTSDVAREEIWRELLDTQFEGGPEEAEGAVALMMSELTGEDLWIGRERIPFGEFVAREMIGAPIIDLIEQSTGQTLSFTPAQKTILDIAGWIGITSPLSALPTAIAGWKAVGAAPLPVKIGTRTILAPFVAAEAVTGAVLKYGIVLPVTKAIPVGVRKAFELALDSGIDKWLAAQGRKGEAANVLFRTFLTRENKIKLTEFATNHLIKRQAQARARNKGVEWVAQQATDDTIKSIEPLLLKTGEVKPSVAKAPPKALTRVEEETIKNDIARLTEVLKTAPQVERAAIQSRITALERDLARGETLIGITPTAERVPEVTTITQDLDALHDNIVRTRASAESTDIEILGFANGVLDLANKAELPARIKAMEKIIADFNQRVIDKGQLLVAADSELSRIHKVSPELEAVSKPEPLVAEALPKAIPGEPEPGIQAAALGVPEVIPPISELVFSGSGRDVSSNFFAPGIGKPLDFAKARLKSGRGGTPIIRVYRRSDIEAEAGVPISELAERAGEKELPSSEFSFTALSNVKPIAEIELPRGFDTQVKDIEDLLFQPKPPAVEEVDLISLQKVAVTPTQKVPVPEVTEATQIRQVIGKTALTDRQIEGELQLFENALLSPESLSQREATIELRRLVLAQRVGNLQGRVEELIVEGKNPEEALSQAKQETMTGNLPDLNTDYFSDLTQEMRDVLFAKVYRTLKDEPFELMSTAEALSNALQGKSIPRIPGVKGGSAFSRLNRVFGTTPQLMKALDKQEKFEDIVEGVFRESGQDPVPLDSATTEYLNSLPATPYGTPTLLEKPYEVLSVEDVRGIVEKEVALTKLQLDTELAEGRISKDLYDIEIKIAQERLKPYPQVTVYEPPIQKAIKQTPMWPTPVRDMVIKVLREVGWSPVDIGNFIRANKASFDFSFWRQQKTLIFGHPVRFAQANIEAWNALWSQKSAEASWERITRLPSFHIYEEIVAERIKGDFLRPLSLEKGTSQWRGVEEFGYLTGERAIPRITQNIPWIKISSRLFVTGTNAHNMLIFEDYYNAMLRLNEQYASGQKKLKAGESFSIKKEMGDFAEMLADFSQRGSLGKAAPLAPAISAGIFAPRATIGKILTPRHLVSANPRIRAEAWKDLSLFVGVIGGLVLLGEAMGLWDVEKDPRSAEYMSIRIGNTRIDPWSGHRQMLVFLTRVITGTGISSVTGAEYESDPIRAMTSFLRGKSSPLASIMLDFWTGRNFIGEEVDVKNTKQWAERLSPFSIWDIYETSLDDPRRAAAVALPAILGEGVQTYTGDWIENFAKLGLPKYSNNLTYGLDEPVYDTKDFWADHAGEFKGVDPATLTEAKGFPNYIRVIAEARIIKEHLSTLPSEKLILINADPKKGTTFVQYYQMWRDRQRLVAEGDEEKLKEFDNNERTRNAHMGNMTQRQYALLVDYHISSDKIQFLENHPELDINPRQDWLVNNPKENALLSAFGQAKILSMDAYKQFKSLIRELDFPDTAIPEFIVPPETSIETHFKYEDFVSDGKHGSWEAQLLLLQDAETAKEAGVESYAGWRKLKLSETPMRALVLKIEHRELSGLYDAYSDRDSSSYISDNDAREEARDKLKTDNPKWVDDMRRVEAIEHEASDTIIEDWMDRGRLVDEFSGGSSEVKVWLLDHPETHKWALEQELLSDDGSEWNEPMLRINARWREQDTEYDALETTEERETYLDEREDYRKDRRRRDAFGLESPTGEQFPETEIENYVEYYELPEKGFSQERFLVDNPEFAKAMHEVKGIDLPDPDKVPDVQYDEIYERFQDDFDKLDGFSDFNSPHYISDPDKREAARNELRFTDDGLTTFGKEEIRRDAYGSFVPENHVDSYVGYYSILKVGKPDDWDDRFGWYEDDWFFMEHMDFYREVYLGLFRRERKDFRNVPSREVFRFYQVYLSLPKGDMRTNYRIDNPELDDWLVLAKGYTSVGDKERLPIERYQEQIVEFQRIIDARLKDLLKRINRLLE